MVRTVDHFKQIVMVRPDNQHRRETGHEGEIGRPRMLERAKQKADLLGVPLPLSLASADSLPFDADSFDVIFSRHLFWTLPDPSAALLEWVRVVKPGAIVAIADGRKRWRRRLWCGPGGV